MTPNAAQVQGASPDARQYKSLVDALVTIPKEEGLRGLYKGALPALLLTSHGAIQVAVSAMAMTMTMTMTMMFAANPTPPSLTPICSPSHGVYRVLRAHTPVSAPLLTPTLVCFPRHSPIPH